MRGNSEGNRASPASPAAAEQRFTALNGGPHFKFNEAVSLQVGCTDQAEVDYYWDRLGAGGDPKAQQCGWLKDKYGLSWQIVPDIVPRLLGDPIVLIPMPPGRSGLALM